jgi:Tol biopolymer transport system component
MYDSHSQGTRIMTNTRRIAAHLGLGLILSAAIANAQPGKPKKMITSAPCERIYVHGIAELSKRIVGIDSVDWSGQNNRLLVDRPSTSRYFSVFTMTPEGFRSQNMLLNKPGNVGRHSGSASWHPSGDYFVFTSQLEGIHDFSHSIPRVGWHSDIWLANREGTSFWQLTNNSSRRTAPKGATNPRFSPDGKKLFWSGNNGKISRSGSPWKQKALYMADFAFEGKEPKLTNIREFQPGENQDFYEAYGFSPDGKNILFAGNVISGNPWYDLDICTMDNQSRFSNLTDTPRVWDRFATYSPDGSKIIWSSSSGIEIRYLGTNGEKWQRYLQTELWLMDSKGRRAKPLTSFNSKGTDQYVDNRVFFGNTAFSPDGKYVAAVLYEQAKNFEPESRIILLKLGLGIPRVLERPGEDKPEQETPGTQPVKPTGPVQPDKPEDAGVKKTIEF